MFTTRKIDLGSESLCHCNIIGHMSLWIFTVQGLVSGGGTKSKKTNQLMSEDGTRNRNTTTHSESDSDRACHGFANPRG